MNNVSSINKEAEETQHRLASEAKRAANRQKSRLKTIAKWEAKLSKKNTVWEKADIGAVSKLLNSVNFEQNETVKTQLRELSSLFYAPMKERKITKTQQAYGINYLRTRYFKLNGDPRKKTDDILSNCEQKMIQKTYSRFTWVGFHEGGTNGMCWHTPVYRLHSKDKTHFDYIAIHWGEIEVVG